MRLVMKAKTTWLCEPVFSVRQTAGRTFIADKSSKGNGTSTTLPFIIERFSVGYGVNIFFLIMKKCESRIVSRRAKPLTVIINVGFFREQNDDTNATRSHSL